MRIAMVSEHANPLATVGGVDSGGQNVHVAALAANLVRRGHEVTVFSRRDDSSAPARVISADGYAVEHVPAGPPADVPKDQLLQYMPHFADYLATRLGSFRYDVVHAHFWMSGVAAVAAAAPTGLPVVQTFHALGTVKRRHQGPRDTSPRSRLHQEAQLCSTVDSIIATCSDEVRELRRIGADERRVHVVPCGVDVHSFVPAPPPRNPRPRLLFLGRVVERKGVGNVIEALASLPTAQLVIAGGPPRDALGADPEVSRLRALAVAHRVADRVQLVGRVARCDVPRLMQSADVVVAVPWYEPFGIVPLEAMACGRPVVGSAVGGLLDTVVPGETGELVPPRRPDLLAGTLRALLADPDRMAAYGRAGFARATSLYRWERVAEQTEAVYESVLARQSQAAMEVLR
jgi:glycosyltransferase involved in cell wall biosynthesis